MAETVNLNTVFSGFDSGTDLDPQNTRTNNQGVTINEIAGFGQIVDAAPTSAAGVKGDMVFTTNGTSTAKLYLCVSSETFTGGVGNDDAVWVNVALAV